jgi:hypothetical protein
MAGRSAVTLQQTFFRNARIDERVITGVAAHELLVEIFDIDRNPGDERRRSPRRWT